MTNANPSATFSARLTPYRSLGPRGFKLLIGGYALVCLFSGALFLAHGAWPIFGFFGLDVLLLYLAFRVNYRAARAFEEVTVSSAELLLRRVSARGRIEEFRFNPFWVRLGIVRDKDEGVTRITLASRGDEVIVGSFLNPGDRETFATALGAALSRVRTGAPA